ncbi:MAG: hypothetical protein K5852_05055 [Eubacterium sp.]|nr:hypothetical protein [Eubacterium sp.]
MHFTMSKAVMSYGKTEKIPVPVNRELQLIIDESDVNQEKLLSMIQKTKKNLPCRNLAERFILR